MLERRPHSTASTRRPRLVYLVTHPMSARILLAGQLAQMGAWGFDVSLISSPGPDLEIVREREKVLTFEVTMARQISLARDGKALARLVQLLRRIRPDIVNAATPKAGLLGMLAARVALVPVRVYHLLGLRLETTTGFQRTVLGGTERVAAACAHEVICVSRSLREAFVSGGYAPGRKVRVMGAGSTNGIDTTRFAPTTAIAAGAAALRGGLGIPVGAPVIGFIGRLSRDKGIVDLLDAFDRVRARAPGAHLLLVSADLGSEDTPREFTERISSTPGAVLVPFVDDVRRYLGAMDALGFPSYREGLPTVVVEAAAMEVPVVGYRVTGVIDAVDDGVTGTLVKARDVAGLTAAIERYLGDPALRRSHGAAGRSRVVDQFAQQQVWRRWGHAYAGWLKERGLPPPRML